MRCPSKGCTETMVHRQGKFGGFWYCKVHGTISDKGMAMLQPPVVTQALSTPLPYRCSPEHDPLMLQIERQTLAMGIQISEVEKFIVDDEDAADYEEDHWLNTRPY